jgi:hypothetical protein
MTQSTEPATPRRSSLPLWIAGAVVVVAAVVVTLVLTAGGTASDTSGKARAAAPTDTSDTAKADGEYDLSTPEAAAESFAAAAGTGSGDELLELACIGRPACVTEHAAATDPAQLAEAQSVLRDGVFELAEHLKGAEFVTPIDGATPGTKDVPYRTPAMTGDAYLTLTFVQSGGDWLYYSPAA